MIISADQSVSIRTRDGIQVAQATGAGLSSLQWGREGQQTTTCALMLDSAAVDGADVTPWLHWIDVWVPEVQYPVWSGVVQKAATSRRGVSIAAADVSVLSRRTRCPFTKSWDKTAPNRIAAELWSAMLSQHDVEVDPLVLSIVDTDIVSDGHGELVDFSVSADAVMLDAVFDQLVQVGLKWSVVGGVPYLGVMPRDPVAALSELDFVDDALSLVRDGSTTFNDVVVRTQDTIARGTVDLGGVNLQTIVNVNDIAGVSNAQVAVRNYLAYMGRIRDQVQVSDGARLASDAPVLLEQLVPSTRFVVEGFGITSLVELGSVAVTVGSGSCDVAVQLPAAQLGLPELTKVHTGSGALAGVTS